MYVRPQTNSDVEQESNAVLLVCSVLRQIIAGVLEEIARTQLASSQPETPGTNQEDSLKCWRRRKPGNMTQETAREL